MRTYPARAVFLGIVLGLIACSSPTRPDPSADCIAELDGFWQGALDGEAFILDFVDVVGGVGPGCAIWGTWRWNSEVGLVQGALRRDAGNTIELMLPPNETTCPLAGHDSSIPSLDGTLSAGEIQGVFNGGYRRWVSSSWDCSEPGDTVMDFRSVAIKLRRTD